MSRAIAMPAIPVSLADNSIRLPLEDGGFHVHMTIPLSLIGHFDPRILECRPRNRWLARLFGEGRSIQDKTFRLAIRPVFQIARQLNGLLFGREEPALGSVGSCDADNWEHFGGSNFHLTFFAGAEDDDNARVLVFEASEKLVQGSIHFSGEELGEEEKAAWIAEWMRMPGWGEPDPFYTPLQCELVCKNSVLNRLYNDRMPGSLDEKESAESLFSEDSHVELERSAVPKCGRGWRCLLSYIVHHFATD